MHTTGLVLWGCGVLSMWLLLVWRPSLTPLQWDLESDDFMGADRRLSSYFSPAIATLQKQPFVQTELCRCGFRNFLDHGIVVSSFGWDRCGRYLLWFFLEGFAENRICAEHVCHRVV